MKSFGVLALAGLAAASPSIYERQVQTMIGVVNEVGQATQALDSAVKGFSGKADVQKLQSASDNVATTVNKGVETVKGASTITLTDAVQIQGQVQNLQGTVEGVVSDLIAKKSDLIAAGAGGQVEDNLQAQLKGATALSAAIAGKVPPEVSGLAQQLSQGIANALQKGVDAFKDAPKGSTSSAPSGGAGAGASTGSSSSSSGSSSSSSSGSAPAGGSSAGTGTTGAKPAVASASGTAPKPATYTGAASPRAVAGSFAGLAALFAIAL